MFHSNLSYGAVLILCLCLSQVRKSDGLKAQTPPAPATVSTVRPPESRSGTNVTKPTIVNPQPVVQTTGSPPTVIIKTNFVIVRILPPQVDAKKVEAEKKRIQQNVLERQTERAKLGDARALYDIGLRYLKGDGVEADREKALEHFRQSAKGGESLARHKLILLGEILPDPK